MSARFQVAPWLGAGWGCIPTVSARLVCFPGEGLVVVGVGDDVAVGVEGDRLAGVAGLLGDFGGWDAAFEGEVDPAVAEVVGVVVSDTGLFAGFADRVSECAFAEGEGQGRPGV